MAAILGFLSCLELLKVNGENSTPIWMSLYTYQWAIIENQPKHGSAKNSSSASHISSLAQHCVMSSLGAIIVLA